MSSTKSVTGHEQGAAGSDEIIYTVLMMEHQLIAPNINLEELDPECTGINLVANRGEGSHRHRCQQLCRLWGSQHLHRAQEVPDETPYGLSTAAHDGGLARSKAVVVPIALRGKALWLSVGCKAKPTM